MLNEFKDLRALLYKTEFSNEILSQLVLLEIKLLEIETRMEYATDIVNVMKKIMTDNTCEKITDAVAIIFNMSEYDKLSFCISDIFGLLDVNNETCVKENWGNKFPPMELPNLSKEDYILWDNHTNSPVEALDIVYHHTSVIEMVNNGFKPLDGERFISVKEIPLRWQILIDAELEKYK